MSLPSNLRPISVYEDASDSSEKEEQEEKLELHRQLEEATDRARRESIAFEDACLARVIQEKEDFESALAGRRKKELLDSDYEYARRLMRDDMDKADREVQLQRRASKRVVDADSKFAAKLHKQETDARTRQLKAAGWYDPPVHCEEVGDSKLRFWVVLPNLHHADVRVTHDAKGDAALHVEAVPMDRAKVPADFIVNLHLTSPAPIRITPADVLVQYLEASATLEIVCLNLKLLKKQSFSQRVSSFLRAAVDGKARNATSDKENADPNAAFTDLASIGSDKTAKPQTPPAGFSLPSLRRGASDKYIATA